ncbi:hypothetical protein GF343_01265 [Candidatus Woesearchaeota archaeon]|nr:hypothetical protein [Candidatus Woesearchaeota archaeon]
MANEDIVEFIVGTYSLSPKMEEKVIRYAIRGIDEWTIDGFNNIYQYIARIIDGLRVPYAEKKISLDQLITRDSDNVLSTLFGVEDADLTQLFEGNEFPERITVDEALSVLCDYFEESDMLLLHQLRNRENGNLGLLNLSAEWLVENIERVRERFLQIVHEFEKDGRLVTPHRKIAYIKFNPLVIKYGNLSDAAKKGMVEAYDTFQGNALVASEGLGIPRTTIRRYWKKAGLKPSGQLPPKKKAMLVPAHQLYGGNAAEAAKQIGCNIQAVLIAWEKAGLESIKRVRLTPFQQYAIYVSYDLCKGNCSEAAKMLGHSTEVVWRYWNKKGLKSKGMVSDDEREKILSAYNTHNGNATAAARALGRSPSGIRYHWKKAGLLKNVKKYKRRN